MNPLNARRTRGGIAFEDAVLVLERPGTKQLVTDVAVDGELLVYRVNGAQQGEYLADPRVISFPADGLSMSTTGRGGTEYRVRRVMDPDGIWWSHFGVPLPSDSIEQITLGGPYMAPGTYSTLDESLWVALDPEAEVVRELIYSSPSGVYVRSTGGWFKMPEDDTSLDGLESIDVSGDFVGIFDAAEQESQQIPRADVLTYEVTDEGGEEPAETEEPEEPEPTPEPETETEEPTEE